MLLPGLAVLLAQSAVKPRLDSLVRAADRIVIGEVVEVRTLAQGAQRVPKDRWPGREVHIAELKVERVLMGPPEVAPKFTLAAQPIPGQVRLGPRLEEGGRGLFFLERDSTFTQLGEGKSGFGERVMKVTGGEPLFALGGAGGVALPRGNGVDVLEPEGAALLPGIAELPEHEQLAALLGAIEQRLDALLPSLHLTSWTTGPVALDFRIDWDGRWMDHGATGDALLSPAALSRLRTELDPDRFFDLPDWIDSVSGPCSGHRVYELRARSGIKRVRIDDGRPREDDTPAEAEARAQLARIDAALRVLKPDGLP